MNNLKTMGKGNKSAGRGSVHPGQRVSPSKKNRSTMSGSFHITAKRTEGAPPSSQPKGAALCPSCGAVYYEKHWRSAAALPAGFKTAGLPSKLCEECRAGAVVGGGKAVGWAGELLVTGVTDPELRAEIMGLIKNVGDRAARRDPEERIIDLLAFPSEIRVYTTENQLAVSIGKQLDRAHKGGKLEIKWSAGDKVARVRWQAGE